MLNNDINLTASQHPHRYYLSRLVRTLLSHLPKAGIIPPPKRPKGISVIMRVKNEVDWIRPSIESIKGIADEIIVVDNGSTDGTPDILHEIEAKEKGLVKIWKRPDLDIRSLSSFALNQTTFNWVWRWDGDMIAHTTGERDISYLRGRILSLDPQRYYVIYLRHINLAGDLFHQDRNEIFHVEEYIYTYSEKAYYIHPGRFEAVKFPRYYKPLFWYEPFVFHVNIKPAHRMLLRYFWDDWMELKDYRKYPRLEDYVKEKIKDEFGTDLCKKAEKICIEKSFNNYIPFNKDIFGPYPAQLEPYLKEPKYKLRYKEGKIVARDEL
jgi:glycosyltransferase involved in cell wall biosynthesis